MWTFEDIQCFSKYKEIWQELNASGAKSQLLDYCFIKKAVDVFCIGNERVAVYKNSKEAIAISIVVQTGHFSWRTFQPANLPVGAWLSRPGNDLGCIGETLIESLPGRPLIFGITQQDPEIQPRPNRKRVEVLEYITTSRITVSSDFDEYWRGRGKNLRHNIKRQTNKLAREEMDTRFVSITDPKKISGAVESYAELEKSGWKGKTNSAITNEGKQGRFYKSILQYYAGLGQAVVWQYYLGGKLAASDLCVHRDGVLVVLKTAYNESLKGYSPAQLMRYDAFKEVFGNGAIERIEFYGPMKDWHKRWTKEMRDLYHVNFYRWAFLKRLHQYKVLLKG